LTAADDRLEQVVIEGGKCLGGQASFYGHLVSGFKQSFDC
jgi:hypothetical protein